MDSFDSYSITPMSAGDIIDRAVRLYRRNFLVLLQIVLAPSLVAYTGSILLSLGFHNFSLQHGDFRIILTVLMIIGGGLIYLIGNAAFLAVLGGASRSVVYHFFDGTPLRARAVYQTVREKLWSLIWAVVVVGMMILVIVGVLYAVLSLPIALFALMIASIGSGMPPWLQVSSSVIFAMAVLALLAVLTLIVLSRIVYVPQVLTVEGGGVFSSIGRSFSLASGELLRIGALIVFWSYLAWSLWVLLIFPLIVYGQWMDVEISIFSEDEPFWFTIAQQAMAQISQILIAPIAMLGFTLLYIDSRVRKEGFDVELLANRVLLAPSYAPPPQVLLGLPSPPPPVMVSAPGSIFGLNDYPPLSVGPPVSDDLPDASPDLDRASTAYSTNGPTTDPATGQTIIDGGGDASEFVPAEIQGIELHPAESHPETRMADGLSVQENVGTVQINAAQRTCRWCGTEAEVEDRFCRVCGAIF